MKGVTTVSVLSAISCFIVSCAALPATGYSDDEYKVMRRLALVSDLPDVERIAEQMLAQGIVSARHSSEPQDLSGYETNDANQPKSRRVRALRHHSHGKHTLDFDQKFVAKSRDGFRGPVYYPAVRPHATRKSEPSVKRRGLFIKRSGSSGIVVPIHSNREVVPVPPISDQTRQNRLQALRRLL